MDLLVVIYDIHILCTLEKPGIDTELCIYFLKKI